jgi:hypothetical protein
VSDSRPPPCPLASANGGSRASIAAGASGRIAGPRQRQIERRRRLVQLIEPPAAEIRHVDRLERHVFVGVKPSADEHRRETRLAAALEEKPGHVQRIDDVGGLNLVELSPRRAPVSRQHVEPPARQRDVCVVQTDDPAADVLQRSRTCLLRPPREQALGKPRQRDRDRRRRLERLLRERTRPQLDRVALVGKVVGEKADVSPGQVLLRQSRVRREQDQHDERGRLAHRRRPRHHRHAAAAGRRLPMASAPNTRGKSLIVAGRMKTSARNAAAMVRASRPPNHAVGLYSDRSSTA